MSALAGAMDFAHSILSRLNCGNATDPCWLMTANVEFSMLSFHFANQHRITRVAAARESKIATVPRVGEAVDQIGFEVGYLLRGAAVEWLPPEIRDATESINVNERAPVRRPVKTAITQAFKQAGSTRDGKIKHLDRLSTVKLDDGDLRPFRLWITKEISEQCSLRRNLRVNQTAFGDNFTRSSAFIRNLTDSTEIRIVDHPLSVRRDRERWRARSVGQLLRVTTVNVHPPNLKAAAH